MRIYRWLKYLKWTWITVGQCLWVSAISVVNFADFWKHLSAGARNVCWRAMDFQSAMETFAEAWVAANTKVEKVRAWNFDFSGDNVSVSDIFSYCRYMHTNSNINWLENVCVDFEKRLSCLIVFRNEKWIHLGVDSFY